MGTNLSLNPKRKSLYLGEAGLKSSADVAARLRLRGGKMLNDLDMGGWNIKGLKSGGTTGTNGANIDDVNATKWLWSPVTASYISGAYAALTAYGAYPVAVLANADDIAFMQFRCPEDFHTLDVAIIIVIPASTQAAANWDIRADFATLGEAYNTHSVSDTTTTYNVASGNIFEVSANTILAAMTASDNVGIRLYLSDNAHDVRVLGFFMTYT